MAQHTTNTQIVDSVCETDLEVLGQAPHLSAAYLDTLMAETTGLMMNQAVVVQQNAQTSGNASLTAACAKILRGPGEPSQPQPEESPRPFVSPLAGQKQLGATIQGDYSRAKSAINALKSNLRKAEFNRQNATDFLESLADLAEPTNSGNGTAH